MHHCWSASRRERSQPRRCKTAKGLIGRLLPLTLVLLCGGCGLSLPSDHTLVVYVGSEVLRDRRLAALSRQANRRIIEGLSDRFRLLRPDARVHIRFLPQERLLPVLRDRALLGLGPDLVLSESTLARAIAAEGLSEPVDLAAIRSELPDLRFIEAFKGPQGQEAIPVTAEPQLACFDRRRLKVSPDSLVELLPKAAAGLRVGLPLKIRDLYWTSSAFGASGPLERLMEVKSGTATLPLGDREALQRWIAWLGAANLLQNVSFHDANSDLESLLSQGNVDWISCSSLSIGKLQKVMGRSLGVAPLPGLPGEPADFLLRLVVLSFGIDSTEAQRNLAEAFALLLVNDVSQKQLMLLVPGVVPVNRNVPLPTKSSQMYRALAESVSHGMLLPSATGAVDANAARLEGQLTRLMAGELRSDRVLPAYLIGGQP